MPCPGIESDANGVNCPWMYEELRAWRHRPLMDVLARAQPAVAAAVVL